MGETYPTKLRTASEKSGAEIRKKDPLEIDVFLERWRYQLKTQGTEWEEPLAVAQLHRKKIFEFLLCESKGKYDWKPKDLFRRILDEMKSFRNEAGGRLIKEYYEDVDEFLKKELIRIEKRERRENIQELKSLLKDLMGKVERTRKTAGSLKKKKRNWHFGVWQHRWPEIPRNNLVSTKAKLDARLQVELGRMFADYLIPEGVSLETISRLILLAYMAGELAEISGEGIRSKYTGRDLKVRNIRENLREVKLHKAESFKRCRDEKKTDASQC